MLCSTLPFRPANKTYTQRNSESVVAVATSSLDENNFIHFFPGFMILKTYLSIVLFRYTLTVKAHRGKGISSKRLTGVGGQSLNNSDRFHRSGSIFSPFPRAGEETLETRWFRLFIDHWQYYSTIRVWGCYKDEC